MQKLEAKELRNVRKRATGKELRNPYCLDILVSWKKTYTSVHIEKVEISRSVQ